MKDDTGQLLMHAAYISDMNQRDILYNIVAIPIHGVMDTQSDA